MLLRDHRIAVPGRVRILRLCADGAWRLHGEHDNIQTNWALYALASWYSGVSNVAGSPGSILPPTYITLGTGSTSGGPQQSDIAMYAEAFGTRQALAYTAIYGGSEAQMTTSYQTTQALGTWTEAGFWDAPTGSAAVGTGGATAGTTTLPLGANAPAMQGGSAPGSYNTAYINDGTSAEYVSIANTAAAGASSWTLQAPLQYSHAAAVPIVCFTGHLFAHAALSPSVTKSSSNPEVLAVQWAVPFTVA